MDRWRPRDRDLVRELVRQFDLHGGTNAAGGHELNQDAERLIPTTQAAQQEHEVERERQIVVVVLPGGLACASRVLTQQGHGVVESIHSLHDERLVTKGTEAKQGAGAVARWLRTLIEES